jgi:hypothetical protein
MHHLDVSYPTSLHLHVRPKSLHPQTPIAVQPATTARLQFILPLISHHNPLKPQIHLPHRISLTWHLKIRLHAPNLLLTPQRAILPGQIPSSETIDYPSFHHLRDGAIPINPHFRTPGAGILAIEFDVFRERFQQDPAECADRCGLQFCAVGSDGVQENAYGAGGAGGEGGGDEGHEVDADGGERGRVGGDVYGDGVLHVGAEV